MHVAHDRVAGHDDVALTGLTIAEDFRDQGQDVLFFVDNIFRFTQAGSEVSALLGRIPSAVGYQPTLATDMGALQERITSTNKGSITSVQAIYVPADDLTDPAPATSFAHLDATTVLSRSIALMPHGENVILRLQDGLPVGAVALGLGLYGIDESADPDHAGAHRCDRAQCRLRRAGLRRLPGRLPPAAPIRHPQGQPIPPGGRRPWSCAHHAPERARRCLL